MSRKQLVLFSISSLLGMLIMYVIWRYWQQALHIALSQGLDRAATPVIIIVITVIVLLVLLSLNGLLLPHNKYILFLYFFWAIPIVIGAGNIWFGIVSALMVWALSLWINWSIYSKQLLFVRPVLSRILPSYFRIWMLAFSLLLSSSLILNPTVKNLDSQIIIPEDIWDAVWQLMGVQYKISGTNNTDVKGVTTYANASQLLSNPELLQQLSQDDIQQILDSINAGEVPISENSDAFEVDLSSDGGDSFLSNLNQSIKGTVREEVESILNDLINPLRAYWPYIIGVSFFVSTQFVTPLIGILGLVGSQFTIWFLLKAGVVTYTEEQVVAERLSL